MIIAIQAGGKDKDPAQTRRHMRTFLQEHTAPGDSLVYVNQPITMMDQVEPVSRDLDLTVTKVTPDFMLYGASALEYSMESLVTQADKHLLVSGTNDLCTIDREFVSLVTFFGFDCGVTVVPYERIEVL